MSSSESESEEEMGDEITKTNVHEELAKAGYGFFGSSKITEIANVGDGDFQALLQKAEAFGANVGTPADKDRQLDVLKDTGLLKALIDESNAQKAVTNPKAYLDEFNKEKMAVLIRSAKAALTEREILSQNGASTDLANEAAKGIFAHEKAKQDLIMAFKYPSDVLKDVEKKIKEKSLVTV